MGGVSKAELFSLVEKVDKFALGVLQNFEFIETPGGMVIVAPTEEYRQWITKFLSSNFKYLLDKGLVEISIEVPQEETTDPLQCITSEGSHNVNKRYKFSNFIVGEGNRIAYEVCRQVVQAPGSGYNPLFLYGKVGLGKTHLLHAVGNEAISQGFRVCYMSASDFSEEMVEFLRSGKLKEFRIKYKSLDFILIDDVQFLSGKNRTQIEFFNIFNHLYLKDKQIILAGDRPPDELSDVSDRLVSRFEGGLVIELGLDEETKIKIIEYKLKELGVEPTETVVNYIYNNTASNVREIEGRIKRFKIKGFEKDRVKPSQTPANQIERIKRHVASYFNIDVEELSKKKTTKKVNMVRHIAIYLCRELTDASMSEIAKAFNRKDHSTVINSIKRIMEDSKRDRKLARIVSLLHGKLKKRI